MILNLTEYRSSNYTNTSDKFHFYDFMKKPIEIYVFLDPLCPQCWALESYLKKLSIEYGRFFTMRPIVGNHQMIAGVGNHLAHDQTNHEKTILFPSVALAIKAAELQGKNAGRTFLRKVQEKFFLKRQNISDVAILTRCAEQSNLDVPEFKKDLYSLSARKAFQSDLKITKEMDVQDTPTIVFFNQIAEAQGVKISGLNPYEIYVHILKEMLQRNPMPATIPSLEEFLAYYKVVAHSEIAIVFDWTDAEADRAIKRLQLKQKVQKIFVNNHIYWKYNI